MSHVKFVLTKVNLNLPGVTKEPILFQGLFKEEQLTEVFCEKEASFTPLDSICIGRVENIVPSMGGAFLRISPEELTYLPLKEAKNAIFSKKLSTKDLCIGDELLVQVCKEPMKTKGSTVTTNLQISGKYMVLTTDSDSVQISKKIIGDTELITCRPADRLAPELDTLRAQIAQYIEQDEDVLSYALFEQVAEKFFEYRKAHKYNIDATNADKELGVHSV